MGEGLPELDLEDVAAKKRSGHDVPGPPHALIGAIRRSRSSAPVRSQPADVALLLAGRPGQQMATSAVAVYKSAL
jgi:hypothetical protein